MSTLWVSQYANETTNGSNGEAVPLTSVSSNEKLIRTVVNWRIQISTQDSGQLAAWYNNGVLSLIEWTVGGPPPIPAPISAGNHDSRDILWSQLEFPGAELLFAGSHDIPGAPRIGEVDTNISRDPGDQAGIVWWNWGLPEGTVPGINIGFWRVWSRCLLEVTP